MSDARPSDPTDESALLERLQAGDAVAYEDWVRESTPRMLAVARRMLRNEEEAQDAVQEAFVSAFKAIGRFQGDSRLSTWLHRITVNAALMRMRTRRRKPEESIEDLMPRFLEDGHHERNPAPWRDGAAELLEREEVREAVRGAISRLPDSYRNVLLLRDIEELETSEVARMLAISTGAVKTRLHRARVALRQQLDESLREDAGG